MLPKDPFILLSYVNTQLRDHYSNLQDFASSVGADIRELSEKLGAVGYHYDEKTNQFSNH